MKIVYYLHVTFMVKKCPKGRLAPSIFTLSNLARLRRHADTQTSRHADTQTRRHTDTQSPLRRCKASTSTSLSLLWPDVPQIW